MLSVGAARVVLPMPIGSPLAGYLNRSGGATGVHDTLYGRAFVASDGLETICLLSADILCVDAEFVAGVRHAIAATGVSRPEAIMVAATHTHAAPAGVSRFNLDRASILYLGTPDSQLRSQVQARLVEAARLAAGNLMPARLCIGIAHVEDVARNRLQPDGLYDPDVPFVVALNEKDRIVAAIFSLASHSTVLGPANLTYSGDLIGSICHLLEARWGTGSVVLGLAGAAGDISTRFTRREASFAEVERLASRVADAIAGERCQSEVSYPVRAAQKVVKLALLPAQKRQALRERLAEARHRLATLVNADPSAQRPIQAEIEGLQVALEADPDRPDHIQAEVQLFKLGRILIAAFPGEMFVAFGLATRQTLAPNHVLIAGYANDYLGYVPTPETTAGYEATVAVVASDSGSRLVEAVCSLAAIG